MSDPINQTARNSKPTKSPAHPGSRGSYHVDQREGTFNDPRGGTSNDPPAAQDLIVPSADRTDQDLQCSPSWTAETDAHGSPAKSASLVNPLERGGNLPSDDPHSHQTWVQYCLRSQHSQPWHHPSVTNPSTSYGATYYQPSIRGQLKHIDATLQTHGTQATTPSGNTSAA